jgi:TRAP transporter 4TM/12TM fusion protein
MEDSILVRTKTNIREDFLALETPASFTDMRIAFHYLAAAFGVWHIATNLLLNEPGIWQNAIHFGGFALLAALSKAELSRYKNNGLLFTLDLIYGLLVFASALWIAGAENDIYTRTLQAPELGWDFTLIDYAAGGLVVFAAIDLTRRLTGWIIPTLILFSLCYILFLGESMPGVFRTASLPATDVLFRSLYNDEGMFGTLTTISSANITLFMIFGGFLIYSGASDFVIEISKIVADRFRGGAAYVAVFSSALTGTISGSAVANTASTGVITIPLMKSNGFRPSFAGAVEASASTGGQLMPPIMGAGAFVMASYTGIAYETIITVSILPAILYFLSVVFAVRIEVMRLNIGFSYSEPVNTVKLRAGALNFVVPLAVMIYMLIAGWTPNYAASCAIGVLIVCSWFTPNKMTFTRIKNALVFGIRTGIMTALLLAAIGLVNNAITTSGVGGAFSVMIEEWSQGYFLLSFGLIALASLVLGMGLPVTAAYIILAILAAPALMGILVDQIVIDALVSGISDPSVQGIFMLVNPDILSDIVGGMGYDAAKALVASLPIEIAPLVREAIVPAEQITAFLLIAHLIIFWLSQDSNVTPPVCLAAYTAAGIAGSKPFETGLLAWKVSKGLYVIPLLFAYTPLISGNLLECLQVSFFAIFGIYAVNALLQQHAEGPLQWWGYGMLVCGAAGCFWYGNLPANFLGTAMVVIVVWLTYRSQKGTSESELTRAQSSDT